MNGNRGMLVIRFVGVMLLVTMTSATLGQSLRAPHWLLGLKGGGMATDMEYTNRVYDIYSHTPILDLGAGAFLKYRHSHRLGFLLDLQYNGGGTHLEWSDVTYQLNYRYLDARLVLALHLGKDRARLSPYLIAGPVVGTTMRGQIHYESMYTAPFVTPLQKGEFAAFNMGVYGGVGIDIPFYWGYKESVFSLEVGIRRGLTDTFTGNEKSEFSNILNPEPNIPLYTMERLPGCLELMARIAIPIHAKKKSEPSHAQSVSSKVESVVEEYPQEAAYVGFDDEYQSKECYTLGQVRDSVMAGKDISGLRICLFNVLFDFDKSEVRPESYRMLQDLGQLMRMFPSMRIKVNGHTDSKGSDEYNEDLSDRRAKSVRSVIMSYGIDGDRIEWQGYGEKYPIDTNETDDGRQRNRRVEIDVLTIPKSHQTRLER